MAIGGVVEMSGYRIKNIVRYIDRMKAYVDEDNWVWERENIGEGYYFGGLQIRKDAKRKPGKNIKDKDLIVVYEKKEVYDYRFGHRTASGVIGKRNVFINNLLA